MVAITKITRTRTTYGQSKESKVAHAFSEKGARIARENIEDAANKKKNKCNKPEACLRLLHNSNCWKLKKTATKI